MRKHQAARALEYLTNTVNRVIDAYQDGSAPNPAEAKAKITEEIASTLQSYHRADFRKLAWLRVAWLAPKPGEVIEPPDVEALFGIIQERGSIVSSRRLGPRVEGDPIVYYVVVHVNAFNTAQAIVHGLEDSGCEVRDWTYGCHRR